MINPKTSLIIVDDVQYEFMWMDFGHYYRFVLFQNDIRLGFRDVPVPVEKSHRMMVYLVRRMVGNYGPIGRTAKRERELNNQVRSGRWGASLRRVWSKTTTFV